MDAKFEPVRPATLIEGQKYLLNERSGAGKGMDLVAVRFVAYCSSPAFVIVSNGHGKMRCAREDVFLLCLGKSVGSGYGGS
jgi:hypothetical protein